MFIMFMSLQFFYKYVYSYLSLLVSLLSCIAAPRRTYSTIHRHVVFPTPDSSRDIELSCPMRQGALKERYEVGWYAFSGSHREGLGALYDMPVTITPVSHLLYHCEVRIDHLGTGVNKDKVTYISPFIIVEKRGESCVMWRMSCARLYL